MLNATWLNTFVTLAEEGSFTRTAARLNMTQPGVSQHLKKLEAALDTELMQRIGKTVLLTDAGRIVYDLGRRRLAEDRALREKIGKDSPDIGPVSIGCSGSFASLLYPRLIPRMVAAPELHVTIKAAPEIDVINGVTSRQLDLGVINRDPHDTRLEAHQIGREDLCLVTPAACGTKALDLKALQDLGFIDHPDGSNYADRLMHANFPDFKGAETLNRRGFVNQITQIPTPVAAGAGFTILPRSGIESHAEVENLNIARLAHPARQDLWLISRAGRKMPLRCQWAGKEIKALADQLAK